MFEKDETIQPAAAERSRKILESPRVLISLHFIPTPHSKTVIALSNGYPFLIEEHVGSGRILLMSVAADTKWSDLPVKGLFVPLVHRSIAYLTQEQTADPSLLAGEERTTRIRNSTASMVRVTKPGATEILVNMQQKQTEKSMRFSDTDIGGIYTVKAGNLVIDKFAVNIDPDEFIINPSGNKRLENVLTNLGITDKVVHTVLQPQETQRIITESRLGTELWKQFLIAALIIAAIEMFTARNSKRSITTENKRTNE
jgi:hypothetical protein